MKEVDWEIPSNEIIIKDENKIGEGDYGKVYLTNWRGTKVVAKVINENLNEEKKYLFTKEYDILRMLHHPHLVQLIGFVKDPFMIIIEYLSNGDLLNYSQKNFLWNSTKKKISLDILRGLAYIHSRNPEYIIHRDIKPQNILISPGGFAKIADLGLARFFTKDSIDHEIEKNTNDKKNTNLDMSRFVGSKRYMSPEMLNKKLYNCSTDIWSLGIILYELFESKRYYPSEGFLWSCKTPRYIKKIITNHMIQKEANNRLSAIELISKFENI